MPVHFLAAIDHGPFLFVKVLGLLGEALRGDIDLADLLIHLGMAALEAGFVACQEAFDFDHLPLPIEKLLAKSGHGQAVLILAAAQSLHLALEAFPFRMEVGTQTFQVILALLSELVNFAEVILEQLPGMGEAIQARARAKLQVR